ncbi:UNVERIFIED_CONTAM: hypothetical protein FKN15_012787 [Acipenser sinensis]
MALQGPGETADRTDEPPEGSQLCVDIPSASLQLGPGDGEPMLPWDRLSCWLHCICVVGFDLELGQAVEVIYPHHSKLTDKEKTSICYLSFPDSNSGDDMFSFLLSSWFLGCLLISCFSVSFQRDQGHYYGYVYFRQVRDKTLKRGYFQKSLVIISRLPYVHFYHSLLKLIAPEYFEKTCSDIERWPAPVPGIALSLPIVGVVVKVRIPACYDKPGTIYIDQSAPQMLWELVLLGESLVVMAPSPAESSETVLALVSCIAPLKYCSDFRPYFTIHDSEFKEYTTRTQAPPSVILGVTNPFFAKTLQHWPHIIRIGNMKQAGTVAASGALQLHPGHRSKTDTFPFSGLNKVLSFLSPSVILGVTNPFFAKTLQHWPHIIRIGDMKQSGDIPKQVKVKKLKNLKTLDSKPGVYSAYKPFLNRDEDIIKQLQKGIQQKRPSAAQNAILRRYFLELTQSFIIPLGIQQKRPSAAQNAILRRYFLELTQSFIIPLGIQQKRPSAAQNAILRRYFLELTQSFIIPLTPPQLRAFSQEEFMKTLEKAGPQLTSHLKGDWIGLYRQFLKSPNFDGWFRTRRKEVSQKLEALHLEALCEEDLLLRIQKHTEVETVDLVLKLKDKLVSVSFLGILGISVVNGRDVWSSCTVLGKMQND